MFGLGNIFSNGTGAKTTFSAQPSATLIQQAQVLQAQQAQQVAANTLQSPILLAQQASMNNMYSNYESLSKIGIDSRTSLIDYKMLKEHIKDTTVLDEPIRIILEDMLYKPFVIWINGVRRMADLINAAYDNNVPSKIIYESMYIGYATYTLIGVQVGNKEDLVTLKMLRN